MSVKTDARDWYIMLHLGGALGFSALFVFNHPEHFDGWCVFVGSIISAFQWLTIHDDKTPDATHDSTPRPPEAGPS